MALVFSKEGSTLLTASKEAPLGAERACLAGTFHGITLRSELTESNENLFLIKQDKLSRVKKKWDFGFIVEFAT